MLDINTSTGPDNLSQKLLRTEGRNCTATNKNFQYVNRSNQGC